MAAAGIIVEYNPLHMGHVCLLEETRRLLGEGAAVICVMSGNFVQRGDFALVEKRARAAAAVRSGADLVLELPVPWAVSSAEAFAAGAVETLAATGLADCLVFGSESEDVSGLRRVAEALERPEFSQRLRKELSAGTGLSFPAARQRALAGLLPPGDIALLSRPNDLLGVEYCKALDRLGSGIQPLALLRRGAPHGSEEEKAAPYSASALRALLRSGEEARALAAMPPAMAAVYREEQAEGRAPVFWETCERGMLARLRSMTAEEFAALDQGREGLSNRLYCASRIGASLTEVLEAAKTKRYPMARLRRMVLWAYLGLTPDQIPERVPYLRPLAANAAGRDLLAQMRTCASVPVLTKPAAVHRFPEKARRLFDLEVRCADLYALAYPRLSAAQGGEEWRTGPVLL